MRPSSRLAHYEGLFYDDFASDSAWIRESCLVRLPPLAEAVRFVVRGEYRPHPAARGAEARPPGIDFTIDGRSAGRLRALPPGPFAVAFTAGPSPDASPVLRARLRGTGWTNFLAWLGRVAAAWPGGAALQRFRQQNKNRQLRISRIETEAGEVVFDFADRQGPFSAAFARRRAHLGLNIAGFVTADLGVAESARAMIRAADAAGLSTALLDLKLHCKNRRGDDTYAARLREDNPYPVNVVHLDPPASRDLDHHHPGFRAGKYNIAYWAWELPEFPDSWLPACEYFDEIWCPSDFTREAIALKSPVPVLAMPHSIFFSRPSEPMAALRARFGLPAGAYLFLCLFDLNSYAERKNPRGALEAFRQSGLGGPGAGLVIKVQNAAANPDDLAALRAAVQSLPGAILLTETLSRADTYALEAACDCLVSLHRAEGFGFVVAEAMFLGKPVISTEWSATAEYVSAANGVPVPARTVVLEKNHGPYAKGQVWAEPDAGAAAAAMRRLHEDRALGARLGAAARATMESRFSPAAIGARYRRRLEAIAGW
ncbi:MAG TPA: glycosyltransferase [Opitutaceae bacterium]|jgi:glycosyltransferase involved in cell wall biosynthesis|nr:glycosyltransferase [Opitutaceae bacterium]